MDFFLNVFFAIYHIFSNFQVYSHQKIYNSKLNYSSFQLVCTRWCTVCVQLGPDPLTYCTFINHMINQMRIKHINKCVCWAVNTYFCCPAGPGTWWSPSAWPSGPAAPWTPPGNCWHSHCCTSPLRCSGPPGSTWCPPCAGSSTGTTKNNRGGVMTCQCRPNIFLFHANGWKNLVI